MAPNQLLLYKIQIIKFIFSLTLYLPYKVGILFRSFNFKPRKLVFAPTLAEEWGELTWPDNEGHTELHCTLAPLLPSERVDLKSHFDSIPVSYYGHRGNTHTLTHTLCLSNRRLVHTIPQELPSNCWSFWNCDDFVQGFCLNPYANLTEITANLFTEHQFKQVISLNDPNISSRRLGHVGPLSR